MRAWVTIAVLLTLLAAGRAMPAAAQTQAPAQTQTPAPSPAEAKTPAGPVTCGDGDREKSLVALVADAGKLGISEGAPRSWVQAGGGWSTIVFRDPVPKTKNLSACAAAIWDLKALHTANPSLGTPPEPVGRGWFPCTSAAPDGPASPAPVLSMENLPKEGTPKETRIRVGLPRTAETLWCRARLVVVTYDGNGQAVAAFNRVEWFSSAGPALVVALVLTALIYVVAVIASKRINDRRGVTGSWWANVNPIVISGAGSGRASASNLQVFVFSLLVFAMVAYAVARLGELSELSTDILVLLGISVGGAGAAKATDRARRRLTLENFAWIESKQWPVRRDGLPSLKQLLTTSGEIDLAKFQMIAFSIVVAIAIVARGVHGLADFDIPETMLGLLGLSQAGYVGGKLITPPTLKEYNDRLDKVRAAEDAYAAAVVKAAAAGTRPPDPAQTGVDAGHPARTAYDDYKQLVDIAAVMHAQIFLRDPPAETLLPREITLP